MPSRYGNKPFYDSKEWRRVSTAYMSSKYYICERCGAPAKICHHRTWLNSENVKDPNIALNPDNLEALCVACHNKEHGGKNQYRRGREMGDIHFNENGEPVKEDVVFIVCGAPASGKTTYVREHKRDGDLVFDLDMINSALRGEPEKLYGDDKPVLDLALEIKDTAYEHIEHRLGIWGRAWVITSSSDPTYWELLAKRLNGKIIEMPVTIDECIARVEADERRINKRLFVNLIEKWYLERSSVASCEGVNE